MTKKTLDCRPGDRAAAFAAEGYKVSRQDQDWRHRRLGLRRRRSGCQPRLRLARHAGGSGGSEAGKVVGQITQLHGVHGVAVAPEFGKGFITNGQSNSVTIFDLKTLAKVGEPQTGQNPDAVCFEPKTKRIFTFNGRSNDSTAIDPKTNEVIKSFPVGGKPEECAVDGAGKIYVNLEDSSEIVEIDAAKPAVLRHASLAPCEGPSGLAIDVKEQEAVLGLRQQDDGRDGYPDAESGRDTAPIGPGPDGAGFDPGPGPGLQLQRRRRNAEHRQSR